MPAHLNDETLNEYADEALAPAARAQAEAHLAGCRACSARLASLRTLFAHLEALPDMALDRDLAPAVTQAVRRTRMPRRAPKVEPRHPLYRLIFPLQALAALVLLAFAWPLVASQLDGLTHLTLPAVSVLSDFLAAVQDVVTVTGQPAPLWAALQCGTQVVWSAFQTRTAWDVPLNLLLAVAASTGLLWLLSHVWLLQHPQRDPARR